MEELIAFAKESEIGLTDETAKALLGSVNDASEISDDDVEKTVGRTFFRPSYQQRRHSFYICPCCRGLYFSEEN